MEEESSITYLRVSTGHSAFTGTQWLWTSGCTYVDILLQQ